MKSILLINYEYPPIGAGAANATYHIAKSLASANTLKVTVVTAGFGTLRGWTNEDTVAVYRCNSLRRHADRSGMVEKLSFLLAARQALPAIVEKTKPDGAIVFFSLPCGPLGLFLKKRYNIPYVISLRGGDVPGTERSLGFIHALLKPLRRHILSNAIIVTANSSGLKNAAELADPFSVHVVPNGVDTSFFAPKDPQKTAGPAFRILFAGRLQEQKNLFLLFKQFSEICRRFNRVPLELHIAGDGQLKRKLEESAQALNISGNIIWHGWLDKTALLTLYQQSNCLVNPSSYEGSPNTVLEAMACGLPVIASDIMGNNELVIENETGFLFDLSHASVMADKIGRIIENRGLGTAMGQKARQRTVREYSWESAASSYVNFFN